MEGKDTYGAIGALYFSRRSVENFSGRDGVGMADGGVGDGDRLCAWVEMRSRCLFSCQHLDILDFLLSSVFCDE